MDSQTLPGLCEDLGKEGSRPTQSPELCDWWLEAVPRRKPQEGSQVSGARGGDGKVWVFGREIGMPWAGG